MSRLPLWTSLWIPLGLGAVLLTTAGLHRLQLDSPGYTQSLLILPEMLSMLGLFLVLIAQPLLALVHLVRRAWAAFFATFATAALCLVLILLGMVIDSPTILYMT